MRYTVLQNVKTVVMMRMQTNTRGSEHIFCLRNAQYTKALTAGDYSCLFPNTFYHAHAAATHTDSMIAVSSEVTHKKSNIYNYLTKYVTQCFHKRIVF